MISVEGLKVEFNATALHLNLVNTVVAGSIQLEDVVGTLLIEGTAALTL